MKMSRKKQGMLSKAALSAICFALVLFCGLSGTLAYLITKTKPITNTFTAAEVKNEVEESFDGTYKSNITVKNTGNIPVYVRVKLITYRVDEGDKTTIIGGEAEIPDFTVSGDWIIGDDGCYYYKKPVPAGESTSDLLGGDPIELREYKDADGGIQVIEVLSEAIQADPDKAAVKDAWGNSIASKLESTDEDTIEIE